MAAVGEMVVDLRVRGEKTYQETLLEQIRDQLALLLAHAERGRDAGYEKLVARLEAENTHLAEELQYRDRQGQHPAGRVDADLPAAAVRVR